MGEREGKGGEVQAVMVGVQEGAQGGEHALCGRAATMEVAMVQRRGWRRGVEGGSIRR